MQYDKCCQKNKKPTDKSSPAESVHACQRLQAALYRVRSVQADGSDISSLSDDEDGYDDYNVTANTEFDVEVRDFEIEDDHTSKRQRLSSYKSSTSASSRLNISKQVCDLIAITKDRLQNRNSNDEMMMQMMLIMQMMQMTLIMQQNQLIMMQLMQSAGNKSISVQSSSDMVTPSSDSKTSDK